nr:elongation of fatty acids protein 3-like [Tanacetum cinerariifolium]
MVKQSKKGKFSPKENCEKGSKEKRIPVKIVREIRAMKREWSAGIGPNGTGRRLGRRKRLRMSDRMMYVRIEVNRNDQVEPHDCAWLHLNFTMFWTAIGLRSACFPFVIHCQMVLLACNVICHAGVLMLHVKKGGCNGIGAWGINSVLNAAILLLFINFYVNSHLRGRRKLTALTSDHRDNVVPDTVESDGIGCKPKDKDI